MLPCFALDLDHSGIRLLLQEDDGWSVLGTVELSSDSFPDDLKELRTKGLQSRAGTFCTKLIIPESEILYRTIAAPGPTDDERLIQIRTGLEGLTPYSADELAFDWRIKGEEVQIAAVAQLTLREAESFAVENNFAPVAFVAAPPEGAFEGEPLFGHPQAKSPLDAIYTAQSEAVKIVLPKLEVKDSPSEPSKEATDSSPEDPKEDAQNIAARFRIMEPATPSEPETLDTSAPLPVFASQRAVLSETADVVPPVESLTSTKPAEQTVATPKPKIVLASSQNDKIDVSAKIPVAKIKTDAFPLPDFPEPKTRKQTLIRQLAPIGALAVVVGGLIYGSGMLPNASLDLFKSDNPFSEPTAFDQTNGVDLEALPVTDAANKVETALIEGFEAGGADPDTVLASLSDATDPTLLDIPVLPDAPLIPVPEGPALNLLQGPADLDGLYIASIDPNTSASDAVALPDPAKLLTDFAPNTQSSPATAETTFALDENGWVIATRSGALTPDGVTIFAGPPNKPSLPRPENLVPPEEIIVDNRLAQFRPVARPSDIIETDERARLGGRTLEQLSAIRPVPRPVSAIDVALQEAAEVEPPKEDAFDTPTERAVARSPKPKPRPKIVTRKVAAPAATVKKPVAKTETAAVEKEGRTGGKKLSRQEVNSKTKTSSIVAQQATLKNAVNLRKINLIGVYGSPSNRRALLRLSNGRYVKVKVGDRVDGGKVSSIDTGELHYVKSGRNITLKVPKG